MAEKSGELNATLDTKETDEIFLQKRTESDAAEIDSAGNDGADNTPDDARQIREQIEETRSQMSETIDAIQDKLSIANITEQVKDQVSEQIGDAFGNVKEAFYGKTVAVSESVGKGFARLGESDLVKKTRENPWIFSVVGMGIGAVLIGALFGNGKKKVKKSFRYQTASKDRRDFREKLFIKQTRQKFPSDAKNESDYQTERSEISAANSGGETAADTSEKSRAEVSGIANSVYQNIGSAAGKTYESIGKASNFTYEKAGDLGGKVVKNYSHYIKENPLAVGAVIFAAGAAIGYAIPLTEIENNFFGEMRDNVLEKAQGSAKDAIGAVKQMAGDAQKIIADEVKSQTAS